MKENVNKMEIWQGWCKVDGTKIEDLEAYILNQIKERQVSALNKKHDLEIMIGTDAMIKSNSKRPNNKNISFMTVIVFKKGKNGAHVIKRRENEEAFGYIPTAVKLNGEINRTAALAFWIREKISIDPAVHLDVNPKESAGSFEVFKYIKGYFEACGFVCEYKPSALAATGAADYYL